MWRIKKGGKFLPLATCMTGDSSFCKSSAPKRSRSVAAPEKPKAPKRASAKASKTKASKVRKIVH